MAIAKLLKKLLMDYGHVIPPHFQREKNGVSISTKKCSVAMISSLGGGCIEGIFIIEKSKE